MKRIIRERHLTPEEAAKYNKIREQVAKEFPKKRWSMDCGKNGDVMVMAKTEKTAQKITSNILQTWRTYIQLNDKLYALQEELDATAFSFRTAETQLMNIIAVHGPQYLDNKTLSIFDGKLHIRENGPDEETKL